MGYIRHHAIAVTSWDGNKIKKAHKKASELFGPLVSSMISSHTNGDISFFIAPDGSKEGWQTSDDFDGRRIVFIEYLKSFINPDGGNALRYAEFYYGDDEYESKIVNHN